MKQRWFGDNRDLIKWGSLIHLAEAEKIELIVHVLYLTESSHPRLQRGDADFPVADRVWKHFRDMDSVRSLCGKFPKEIHVFDAGFRHADRAAYHETLAGDLGEFRRRKKVVFLDPDTGIAPSRATERHVTTSEISMIWNRMSSRDWLVAYQHRHRRPDWQAESIEKFRGACSGAAVEVFSGPDVASDVVLLAAMR